MLENIIGVFFVWVALFVVCGALCAQIARENGHSPGAWGCLGFLLGPIAFLIAWLIPPNYKGMEHRDIEKGLMRRCPRCHEWVQKKANLCRHCGSELSEPD
ncbi:MAG: zinc ribbon domain-containing protein [Acidobacteriia bacterium]|nr:zinc ribbon domain-containing protein [Terriglobia bacterium]